jgi:hypothetical protein
MADAIPSLMMNRYPLDGALEFGTGVLAMLPLTVYEYCRLMSLGGTAEDTVSAKTE